MKEMWVWMLVTTVALVINGWCNQCCYGCLEEERIGLLNIKAWINDPHSSSMRDWMDDKRDTNDCCNWSGVACDNTTGRVTGIDLWHARDSNLGDLYLNSSLFLPFKELKSLYLIGNKLAGCFENQGFEVLSSSLRKLERLYLAENKFNDSILLSLGGFSSLKILDLSDNMLTASTDINDFEVLSSRLKKLEGLYLGYNKFNDSILLSLGGFSSLKILDLSGNMLTGSTGISGFEVLSSSLRKLEELDLGYNKFNESILLSLGGFSSLKILDLSRNMLTGSTGISGFEVLSSSLRKLEQLDLGSNKFNDSILSSLGGFSSLKILDLSDNMLTGSTGINGLRMLEQLNLDGNNMTGSILLQSLGALPSLKTIYADINYNLTWTNSTWPNFTKLESLYLSESLLPSNFLERIGTSSTLKELFLFGCDLSGTLSTQGLCELKKLEYLDLSENHLEGPLPACLGNLTSLRQFDVASNQFHGDIASSPLTNLTLLHTISISSNHFQVPSTFKSFMNHSNLRSLSCSDNKLIAEPSFQNFVPKFQLHIFDLSNCTSQTPNTVIPNFLYSQHDLLFLDLSHNGFRGAFPSWLLENNTKLGQIYLGHNSFAGPFLFPLHQILKVQDLDISNNNIDGQIPTNTCSVFPYLENLNMSQNGLVSSIPSCFGSMSYLRALDLSNNNLSLVNLEQVMSSSLQILMLSNNFLDGQLVSLLGFNSSALELLDISNNHFYGMFPRWIGNLTYLTVIDLSGNQFEGSIPPDLCKLQNLEFFDISDNRLSGPIPICFSPPQMSHVHLYKNRFDGPFTHVFSNSSSMVSLDIAHNDFIGSIPNSIGNFSALSVLVLKANHFYGDLPDQLCKLKQLSILDVSQNNLSGPLPSCLGSLTFKATSGKVFLVLKFQVLSSAYVVFGGPDLDKETIPDEDVEFTTKGQSLNYKGNILNFMSGIDLSCNKFTGEIPMEFGYLREIHALNLSHNNLSGLIPSTFLHLKLIESLDMSYNKLIGAIPQQLTELTFLANFSVAHNNLSGKTPEMKNQFGTFDVDCYEGNPFLCGPPLQNSCSETESPSQPVPNDSNGKEEDGFIDMNVFYATFGVCYLIVVLTIATILYINPYWRSRWFYFIEWCIDSCYYFVLDCFLKLSNFICL